MACEGVDMVLSKRTRDYLIEDVKRRLVVSPYGSKRYKRYLELLDELYNAGDVATVDIKRLDSTEEE